MRNAKRLWKKHRNNNNCWTIAIFANIAWDISMIVKFCGVRDAMEQRAKRRDRGKEREVHCNMHTLYCCFLVNDVCTVYSFVSYAAHTYNSFPYEMQRNVLAIHISAIISLLCMEKLFVWQIFLFSAFLSSFHPHSLSPSPLSSASLSAYSKDPIYDCVRWRVLPSSCRRRCC